MLQTPTREVGQAILNDLVQKWYEADPPSLTLEILQLPSCGLMGDQRVYGYAWNIQGVANMAHPTARALLKEVATRLTTEVRMEDGTPFVRVFVEASVEIVGVTEDP